MIVNTPATTQSRSKTAPNVLRDFARHFKEASSGCKECNETHPAVLEFHHRDPSTKVEAIGYMVKHPSKFTLQQLKDEIAKCDLLCSNHHKIVHWNWSRSPEYKK